jgi:serine/threonine protein kinase
VIHRDLKLANVLLEPTILPRWPTLPCPRIDDVDRPGARCHRYAIGHGSPSKAAGKGNEVGPLADVYALGAVLYECLTGRPPFKAATLVETLEQVRSREPVRPGLMAPEVPRDLEAVCLKCLEKEPRHRYTAARDLADDLDRFRAGEPVHARPVGTLGRFWRMIQRDQIP